jgi:hypothetical protein
MLLCVPVHTIPTRCLKRQMPTHRQHGACPSFFTHHLSLISIAVVSGRGAAAPPRRPLKPNPSEPQSLSLVPSALRRPMRRERPLLYVVDLSVDPFFDIYTHTSHHASATLASISHRIFGCMHADSEIDCPLFISLAVVSLQRVCLSSQASSLLHPLRAHRRAVLPPCGRESSQNPAYHIVDWRFVSAREAVKPSDRCQEPRRSRLKERRAPDVTPLARPAQR